MILIFYFVKWAYLRRVLARSEDVDKYERERSTAGCESLDGVPWDCVWEGVL